jgi:hypothetical protein
MIFSMNIRQFKQNMSFLRIIFRGKIFCRINLNDHETPKSSYPLTLTPIVD